MDFIYQFLKGPVFHQPGKTKYKNHQKTNIKSDGTFAQMSSPFYQNQFTLFIVLCTFQMSLNPRDHPKTQRTQNKQR